MAEDGRVYLLVQLLLDISIFNLREEAKEYVVLLWTGIRGLGNFLAAAASVKKVILIHIHRDFTVYAFTLYLAKTTTLDDSFEKVPPELLDMDQSADNSILLIIASLLLYGCSCLATNRSSRSIRQPFCSSKVAETRLKGSSRSSVVTSSSSNLSSLHYTCMFSGLYR